MSDYISMAISLVVLVNSLVTLKLCLVIERHSNNIETYVERIASQMRHR